MKDTPAFPRAHPPHFVQIATPSAAAVWLYALDITGRVWELVGNSTKDSPLRWRPVDAEYLEQ